MQIQSYTPYRRWDIPDQGTDGPLWRQVLERRGVRDIEAFVKPMLSQLPKASDILDMVKAGQVLMQAVNDGRRICVYGDYDVDGATSTAILVRYLRDIGYDAGLYVPDRLAEGYGPNAGAMDRLKADGYDLVVIVDSGIVAFGPLSHAREIGLDVVVIDHHGAQERVPEARAVVNPNRLDDPTRPDLGHLCAAGLTFLFVHVVNTLRKRAGQPVVDVRRYLPLAALGTVADVVPLTGPNRVLVHGGLRLMGSDAPPGLLALARAGDRAPPFTARDLGWVLGPRINAGGRIGTCSLGAEVLATNDPEHAAALGEHLNELNRERQEMCERAVNEAIAQVSQTYGEDLPNCLVAAGDWHPGIVGIVAGRLRERFHRPSVVLGVEANVAKGSARSVPGFDVGSAIRAAADAGLLLAGGGHPMAGGLTVAMECLEALTAFLCEAAGQPVAVTESVDVWVAMEQISVADVEALAVLEPHGAGNAEPVFAMRGCLMDRRMLKDKHLSVRLRDGGSTMRAIAFNVAGSPLCEALMATGQDEVILIGNLSINRWKDRRSVEMKIVDAIDANSLPERVGRAAE
jgi:single-stranded-DNA-specific exonuclease